MPSLSSSIVKPLTVVRPLTVVHPPLPLSRIFIAVNHFHTASNATRNIHPPTSARSFSNHRITSPLLRVSATPTSTTTNTTARPTTISPASHSLSLSSRAMASSTSLAASDGSSSSHQHRAAQHRPSDVSTASTSTPSIRYIAANEAQAIDEELMSPASGSSGSSSSSSGGNVKGGADETEGSGGCGFLLPQLMELAGLACAQATHRSFPPETHPELLVAAGPGNQGGDGLVAARHLQLWGYNVKVWYPKQGKTEIFQSLRRQLEVMRVPFIADDDFEEELQQSDVILDSIFGFSFQGPPRPPFASALEALHSESHMEFVGRVTRPPIISVDIPSGWSVDTGNPDESKYFTPEAVISLTAPKKGMKGFKGQHWLGGRFLPPRIVEKYALAGVDGYQRDDQVVDITGWAEAEVGIVDDDVVE